MHSKSLADSSILKAPLLCAKFKKETIILSATFWSTISTSTRRCCGFKGSEAVSGIGVSVRVMLFSDEVDMFTYVN
jgi:hypothetical protein